MGRMLRPKKTVLAASALIPNENVLHPAPNVFTHRLVVDAPYFFSYPKGDDTPNGTLHVGTKVLLMRDCGDGWCAVADHQGLYVVVKSSMLATIGSTPLPPLPPPPSRT